MNPITRIAPMAIILIAVSTPVPAAVEHKPHQCNQEGRNGSQGEVRQTNALQALENMNRQLFAIEKERRLVIKNIPRYINRITWTPVSKQDHDLLVREINSEAKRKADQIKHQYRWARRCILA